MASSLFLSSRLNERGLKLLERRVCVPFVLGSFGTRHILRHVGGSQIEARGGKIRIEIDRQLEIVGGGGILARS